MKKKPGAHSLVLSLTHTDTKKMSARSETQLLTIFLEGVRWGMWEVLQYSLYF